MTGFLELGNDLASRRGVDHNCRRHFAAQSDLFGLHLFWFGRF
jgi:hypothetical protein